MKYLVIDSGLYVTLASALSDNGRNTVYYYTSTSTPFPTYKEYAPGDKFEHITKIKYFWDYVDTVDCIVSFDVGDGDLINYLRTKYPDKSVFGSGLGERLENNRQGFKKVLESLSLPVVPYIVITGMTKLRKYLESNPKKVVKIDMFRGDFETLICPDYDTVKQVLNDRSPLLGLYAEECEFLVEDMIECKCEAGLDGFFSGGMYVPFSYGIEFEKNLYIGKVTQEPPEVLMETMDAMAPVLNELKYNGAISTEERIVSKSLHYFIDPCMRVPLPLGVLYSRFITNWPEFVYAIGKGEPIEPQCEYSYVGAFALASPHAREHFTLVQIEKGHEADACLMMACQAENGEYYAVKGQESVVIIVAGGDSPKQVIDKLKDNAQYVKAFNLEDDAIKGIGSALDSIDSAKEVMDF